MKQRVLTSPLEALATTLTLVVLTLGMSAIVGFGFCIGFSAAQMWVVIQ